MCWSLLVALSAIPAFAQMTELHGSGTTNPKNWFANAMKIMEHRARVPMLLTYRAVGSSTGQKEFLGQSSNSFTSYNHFGAGDIPMSKDRYDELMAQSPPETMVHLPFALGAIGIFHSVPTSELGGQDLKLDACLLAQIFSGVVTTWDDQKVKDQNPTISVPAGTKIQIGHRRLGSSSTGGLAGYLDKKCKASWPLGTGSKLNWPTSDNFNVVEGSPGMQDHIKDTKYAIGYLDAGHGHDYGFSEVALTNAAGKIQTSKASMAAGGVAAAGAAAVSSGTFPADHTQDWSAVNLYDMAGADTWPIVLVSYMYVKKNQTNTNPRTAAALQAFVDFILNNRDSLCQKFGFTVPPSTMSAATITASQTIDYPVGMTSFTYESSTDVYGGMSDTVISAKRHSWDDYERETLAADVAKLMKDVATLMNKKPLDANANANTNTNTNANANANATNPTVEAKEDQNGMILAALILAIVAVVLAPVGICMGVKAMQKAGGGSLSAPATSYGQAA